MNNNFLVINMFVTFFSILIIREFLNIFLLPKNNKLIRKEVLVLSVYFGYQIFQELFQENSPLMVLIVNMMLVFLFSMFAHSDKLKRKISVVIMLYIVWIFNELLVSYVFLAFGISYTGVKVAVSIISKIIMLTFIEVVKMYKEPSPTKNISIKYWLFFLFVPISSIYIIHNIFKISNTHTYILFSVISSVLILLNNYIVFKAYIKLTEEIEIHKQNIIFRQQLEICNRQAIEQEETTKEIRKMKHEMKQHLILLKSQIQRGKNERAVKYIENMIEVIAPVHDIVRSGNIIVDSMVNNKCAALKKYGIKFKVKAFVPSELKFDSGDLCILLGNAFDNAIEAVLKADDKKFIEVAIVYVKGSLSIVIQNTFDGIIRRSHDGDIITTKEDEINHGIGLMSIEKVVKKYNGELVLEVLNKVFILEALLYE